MINFLGFYFFLSFLIFFCGNNKKIIFFLAQLNLMLYLCQINLEIMKLHNKIQEAQFDISKKLLIRYKKGYGFWIHKEIENGMWYTCLRICRINPFALGFKGQYGFGYDDMKPYFFDSFEEALKYVNKVDILPYWEYNEDTHIKFFDTIMRAHKAESILNTLITLDKHL